MANEEFFTFSEYMKKEDSLLTASLEDYMEMIYRLSKDSGYTRINDLADALNVQPPSVTKAVQKLAEQKLINYEKYGIITMCEKGKELGKALLRRHNIIEDFLRLIGIEDDKVLEETEKIEHTISDKTTQQFAVFVDFLRARLYILDEFADYVLLLESKTSQSKTET